MKTSRASVRDGISVFPLAFPLIAGPGAMTTAILLMGWAGGEPVVVAIILSVLICILTIFLDCCCMYHNL
ncbi:MAG: multiple antibiotic resistance protein [Rhodospirillaceae bacterium]|nr:MAG: multiple antibiotic resistance protein [Rhodospirillaceae bacterium]